MSAHGTERPGGRPADGRARQAGAPDDDDAPLADLTAGGPSPLEDLGAPWEGPAPGASLPDLSGAPTTAEEPAESATTSDDDWSPTPPLDASAPSPGTEADDDWAPLPDLARRGAGRRARARRAGTGAGGPTDDADLGAGGQTRPRARAGRPNARTGARDRSRGNVVADPQSADPQSADAASSAPSPDVASPDATRPPDHDRGDGLPPGALGAGAAGVGQLFGAPESGDVPTPDAGRRGRRKGRRRRADPDADAGGASSASAPESDRPLTAEERLQQALALAYRHLSKRDRTVSEVREHLQKREIDEASIAGALKELTDFGYVDDERYAARFVEDKRRLEGWGHLRIEQGLRRTGVPREVADRVLAEDPLRGDEDELAAEALERRLAGRPLEDDRARQKALRLLATKGYALDTAYAAVRAYERRCAERDGG